VSLLAIIKIKHLFPFVKLGFQTFEKLLDKELSKYLIQVTSIFLWLIIFISGRVWQTFRAIFGPSLLYKLLLKYIPLIFHILSQEVLVEKVSRSLCPSYPSFLLLLLEISNNFLSPPFIFILLLLVYVHDSSEDIYKLIVEYDLVFGLVILYLLLLFLFLELVIT
jgi:hypothetical protein